MAFLVLVVAVLIPWCYLWLHGYTKVFECLMDTAVFNFCEQVCEQELIFCILLEAVSFILIFLVVVFLYVGITLNPLSKLLQQFKNGDVRSGPPFFFARESYNGWKAVKMWFVSDSFFPCSIPHSTSLLLVFTRVLSALCSPCVPKQSSHGSGHFGQDVWALAIPSTSKSKF